MKISALKKLLRTEGGRWFSDEIWKYSSTWEQFVVLRLNQLFEKENENKFSIEFTGFGAGVSGRIKDDRTDKEMAEAPFDLLVKKDNVKVAELEIAADRKYTWNNSHVIPTRADKVERAKGKPLPCFMVYVLTREDPPRVLWLPFNKIAAEGKEKSQFVEDVSGTPIMAVSNYYVRKEIWNIGLESLVSELFSLAGRSSVKAVPPV